MTNEPSLPEAPSPKFIAGVDMIGRTGCKEFQLRYSDDEEPVVWMCVATYGPGRFEVGGARDPEQALMRLLVNVIDGGVCTHCGYPSAFDEDFDDTINLSIGSGFCWTMWDPELGKFRRGCE